MKRRSSPAPDPEELIFGRQAVLEALKYKRLRRIFLQEGQRGAIIETIVSLAGQSKTPLAIVNRSEFAALVKDIQGHQGVAALSSPFRYLSLDQLVKAARSVSGAPFLLLLDHLQDPQNLGSIIRTADAAGVHGLVIPEPRSARVTPAARKVAAGAAERARIALVKNMARSVEALKKDGFWVYGAEADGELSCYEVDYKGPLALVVGSEAKGLSRNVREHCDRTLRIPMREEAASLNVAVAAAVLIYTAQSRREGWDSLPPVIRAAPPGKKA